MNTYEPPARARLRPAAVSRPGCLQHGRWQARYRVRCSDPRDPENSPPSEPEPPEILSGRERGHVDR